MILEIIITFIVLLAMISIIVVSWQKQQYNQHMRHMSWMKENLKTEYKPDGGMNDNSTNNS